MDQSQSAFFFGTEEVFFLDIYFLFFEKLRQNVVYQKGFSINVDVPQCYTFLRAYSLKNCIRICWV